MSLLFGAIGWGLLAIGAALHIVKHERLRHLLGLHLDHERWPAFVLTTLEAALGVALPVAYFLGWSPVSWLALGATALGLGFVVWISRLLASDSSLPCACSFSEAPTSVWSLVRALCVCSVIGFVWADAALAGAQAAATLITGLAVAGSIYVLPEALSWPATSRALLIKIEAASTEPVPTEDAAAVAGPRR